MRKLISLFLMTMLVSTLCLSFATAETVTLANLRTETAGGWHQTYEAHGRTVTVDIPVQVPKADAIPALTAEVLPPVSNLPNTTGKSEGVDVDGHYVCNQPGFFRLDTPDQATLRAHWRKRSEEAYPRGMEMQPNIIRFNALEWDTPYTYNLTATLRDADALMQSALDEYFAGDKITLAPHWIYARAGYRTYDRKAGVFSGEVWEGSNAPLIVYFDQVLNGIPVLTSAVDAFSRYRKTARDGNRSSSFGGIAILQDEGMEEWYTSAQFNNVLRVKSAEDTTLCDFATVFASCERLISDGRLRKVDSLRLGYAVWYGKGDSYTLMPVWALEGELFESADMEYSKPVEEARDMPAEYGTLLFDAQTGAFLDPWTANEDCAYHAPTLVR